MLVLEAFEDPRAAISGYSVHIGGLPWARIEATGAG